MTVHRETLTQYPTLHLKERGGCTLVLCSLANVMSCMDLSVRIVSKSPKVGPLLIFSHLSGHNLISDSPIRESMPLDYRLRIGILLFFFNGFMMPTKISYVKTKISSRIPKHGSNISNKRGDGNNLLSHLFVGTNSSKLKN